MSERVGFWCDFENPYITYKNSYIESVWWAFKQLDEKGLLYKGHKVIPYCPRCETALSSHEVSQGYQNIKTESIFVRFAVKGEDNTYFIAWTTTPWTLLSNTALCVKADALYSKIKVGCDDYYMASDLVESLFKEYELVAKLHGRDLAGKEYTPLFDFAAGRYQEKSHYVVCDDYVTLDSGSGIVHQAPAFGEDDARVGRENGLPFIKLVNESGKFVEGCGKYSGKNVMECDPEIIQELRERGDLLKVLKIEHTYPYCWRCHNPLIYYAKDSWFINMSSLRDQLVANNRAVNWFPEHFKEGRMGNFVSNVIDWAVSRDRYWGTPLPVWVCGECGHHHTIGSIAELTEFTGAPEDTDLHKPAVDNLTMTCPKCGKVMRRTPEVVDCWIDSGAMPFAQHHYPFENKDVFEKQFPADFISEGSDQSRGWFYSLQALSTALFGVTPYRNCIALGLVNDENGVKMSKHLGNVISPWEVLDEFGADAVRLYFCIANAPWVSTSFSKSMLLQFQGKFLGTLWASSYFYRLYSDIDHFNPTQYCLADCSLNMMDRWILSRLHSLIEKVTRELDSYHVFETTRAINNFIEELSNWYIRRGRRRFFKESLDDDKIAAYMTLHTVLTNLIRLIAPVTPFMPEVIYQELVRIYDSNAPKSVHLTDYPEFDAAWQDLPLEAEMDKLTNVVYLGRRIRELNHLRNRQPLSECLLLWEDEIQLTGEMIAIIGEELNIDKVDLVGDLSGVIRYELKPQLKTLGAKYGKLVPKIQNYLAAADGNAVMAEIKATGLHKTVLEGTEVEFTADDLLVTENAREGYVILSEGGVTMAINTTLSEDLVQRGLVREVISKIQNQRKVIDFNIMDRILVKCVTDEALQKVILDNQEEICSEVLANRIQFCGKLDQATAWKIDDHDMEIELVLD